MSNITQRDWNTLTFDKDTVFNETKRRALLRFVTTFIVLTLYSGFSYFVKLEQDFLACLIMMGMSILFFGSISFCKNSKSINHLIFLSKIAFLSAIGYFCVFTSGESIPIRFLVTFLCISVLHLNDIGRTDSIKMYILSIFIAGSVLLMNLDFILKVNILVIIGFVTVVIKNTFDKQSEHYLLNQQKKNFDMFIKHSNLMEHHIINSITKMTYYLALLEEEYEKNNDIKVKEQIDKLKNEIDNIEKILIHTDGKTLDDFKF